jgi:hypothetical protein
VVAEGAHVLPRNQELGSAAGPYDDPVDEVPTGLLHQVGGQVGESADDAAVAGEDILTGEPAEQQHSRSMPHCGTGGTNRREIGAVTID